MNPKLLEIIYEWQSRHSRIKVDVNTANHAGETPLYWAQPPSAREPEFNEENYGIDDLGGGVAASRGT